MSDDESNVPLTLAESIRRKVAEARKEKGLPDDASQATQPPDQPTHPVTFSDAKVAEAETYVSQFKRKIEEARAKTRDLELITGPFNPNGSLIREREKAVIHKLRAELDLSKLTNVKSHVQKQVQERIRELIAEDHAPLNSQEKGILYQNVCDEIFGYGPLGILLRDPTVNGIFVNGCTEVFVERAGLLERVNVAFENREHIMQVVEKITQDVSLDSTYPMGTSQLPNGSRAEIIISPVSMDGPVIAIRCNGFSIHSLGHLTTQGVMTEPMAELLRSYVQANVNIVLCGAFGSGRSTLLNALSVYIQPNHRIVSIEDSPGIRIQHINWVRLRSDFSADNREMSVTKRKIVAQAMRMRPDRLVLCDCAGDEGYEFLQGLNGGRSGDMVTMVAGSIKDCLRRFETMVRWGDSLIPQASAREIVADAMQAIVHLKRLPDGRRVVSEIAEVHGLSHGEYEIHTLYKYERDFDESGVTTYNHRAVDEHSSYVEMGTCESAYDVHKVDLSQPSANLSALTPSPSNETAQSESNLPDNSTAIQQNSLPTEPLTSQTELETELEQVSPIHERVFDQEVFNDTLYELNSYPSSSTKTGNVSGTSSSPSTLDSSSTADSQSEPDPNSATGNESPTD